MQRPSEEIRPVESYLAYWFNYVGYRLAYQLRLRAQRFGVTAAEWVLLRKLSEEEGATSSYLAVELGLNRSTTSRLAVRLEAKGFIHRNKSTLDRRTLRLTLTDAGRAVLPVVAAASDWINARNFAPAGDASLETTEQVTKWIVRRHRYRFVPPGPCRVRRYPYLDLDIEWDGEVEGGEGDYQ
jgi:DNA-binding MarR family transcriptional regulator